MNKKLGEKKRLVAKQSFSVFDRAIEVPSYNFSGIDYNAFTDISYVTNGKKHAFVAGRNFVYNNFREKQSSAGNRDNTLKTIRLFAQHTWDATEKLSDDDIEALSRSNTIGVLLPGAAFFLRSSYARARDIINAGCALALASDYNPGSSIRKREPHGMHTNENDTGRSHQCSHHQWSFYDECSR